MPGPNGDETFILARSADRRAKEQAMHQRFVELMEQGALMEELAKIQSSEVVLPTMTRDGRPGRTVRVRCVTTPDPAQRILLHRLGLTLPQRLRYLEEVAQM
ncbi:MAG: hypothetical protein V2A79_00085 [Planctomycetota bacterium]